MRSRSTSWSAAMAAMSSQSPKRGSISPIGDRREAPVGGRREGRQDVDAAEEALERTVEQRTDGGQVAPERVGICQELRPDAHHVLSLRETK